MAKKEKQWGPHPSRKGVLTARAKKAGRSIHAEAEKDAHTKGTSKRDKRLRAQGVFALNAQEGKFKHKHGKSTVKAKPRKKSTRRRATAKRMAK